MKNRTSNSLIFGVCSIVLATASYALINPAVTPEASRVPLPLPAIAEKSRYSSEIEDTAIEADTAQETQYNWIIEPGDSLSSIFSKLGLAADDLHKIIFASESGRGFHAISSGKTLQVKISPDGKLAQLTYEKNPFESLIATRINNQFTIENHIIEVEHRLSSAHTTISNSLFEDGKRAGMSDKTIMQLSQIFAWDIDFATNLRDGDEITVLYEKLYVNNNEIDIGDIVAARVINQGRTYTAIRYKDTEETTSYYTPNGQSMRKAFLRNPVDFARITSGFNLRRKHPILHKIRAHKGVDFAAKTGTPVKSTGDGKIIFVGRKGGYGRVIIVQHGKRYSTLYAHLLKYGNEMRTGKQVKQGQIIGYVGQSGLASGPHLHYEFRVDGKHRNPLTVHLPKAEPINQAFLLDFKNQANELLSQLDQKTNVVIAQSDPIQPSFDTESQVTK